MTHSFI